MILSSLYIDYSPGKGRGVFTKDDLPTGTVIEISPVIVMTGAERLLLDQTLLHDYIFVWGEKEDQCCVALGYLSVYNHNYESNAEYEMNFSTATIEIKVVRSIPAGQEIFINYNGDWNNTKPLWFDAGFPTAD